jgi:hypothetical protein
MFSLEETEGWLEHSLSQIYINTFDGLIDKGAGRREFELLADFYRKTALSYVKEEYIGGYLRAYVKIGLADENFNWIGGDSQLISHRSLDVY